MYIEEQFYKRGTTSKTPIRADTNCASISSKLKGEEAALLTNP